jgi:hypothetical protein
MEVRGQLHVLVALPLEKRSQYPFKRMLGEPTELVWTFWRIEEISCFCWDLNPGLSS